METTILNKLARDKVGGYSLTYLWHGIEMHRRGEVALVLASLIAAGKVRMVENRFFDRCGNSETETCYRIA